MMDAKTLKALKGSIKKWEGIVAGTSKDEGTDNCALCRVFHENHGGDCCAGCPVDAAGHFECQGSPYDAWISAHNARAIDPWDDEAFPRAIHDDDTAIAAVLELEFLRSLLPDKP